MNKIWIISRKDISDAFRSRSTYVFLIVMVFLTFSYISVYTSNVNALKNDTLSINNYSRAYLSTLAYILPLMFKVSLIMLVIVTGMKILNRMQ